MSTLNKLANTLMDQLSVINKRDISAKDLKQEIARADSMAQISKEIISNANLQYKAQTAFANGSAPKILKIESDE